MLEYDNNYIRRLIQLDLVGGLSPEEKGKLENWIDESEEHRLLFYKIKKQLSVNEIRNYLQTDVEDAWKKVREKTFGAPAVRPRRVLKWLKYAAVVIPVSLSLSLWYAWKEKMENKQATVACLSPVLTLDNGEKYQLDPEEQTEIYVDEEVKAYQAGGGLIYDTTARQEENKYNRIEVPRGSEYWIVLPDGTRVWLNAATELKYPVRFVGKERRVYLSGEAYFEVQRDTAKPFIVVMNGNEVRVLGTEFNVRSYKDEKCQFTTLVTGKVLLTTHDRKCMELLPNEQGIVDPQGELRKEQVDVALYTAWKDGNFVFRKQCLENIMEIVERWYDLKVTFEDEWCKQVSFSGNVERYDDFSKLAEMLEATGSVKFKIKNNEIYVTKR